MVMFCKLIFMLLICFSNEEVLVEFKWIDGMVLIGCVFDVLKVICGFYLIEEKIFNDEEMILVVVEQIWKEIVLWLVW